jgi:hypothetical protein
MEWYCLDVVEYELDLVCLRADAVGSRGPRGAWSHLWQDARRCVA